MPLIQMILSWLFGILFAVIGLLNLPYQLVPGVVCLLFTAILLPPINALLASRWKLHLPPSSKTGFIILGILLIGTTVTEMEVRTQIDIDAPPDRVWEIFSDFPGHSNWNPFIRTIEGEAREGARLIITVDPPEGDPMTFEPTILVVRPDEELQWLGRRAPQSLRRKTRLSTRAPRRWDTHTVPSFRKVQRFARASALGKPGYGHAARIRPHERGAKGESGNRPLNIVPKTTTEG